MSGYSVLPDQFSIVANQIRIGGMCDPCSPVRDSKDVKAKFSQEKIMDEKHQKKHPPRLRDNLALTETQPQRSGQS